MKVISLLIFVVATSIHLFASLQKNKKLRNYTKPFILTSLMLLYMSNSTDIRPTIILALLFSWIGDLLLMPDGIKWFTMGGISFMISHFFFILGYLKDITFSKMNSMIVIILGCFFIVVVSFIFSKLKKHLPKQLFYPMYLYLLINGAMNCFAIYRMISNVNSATITTCIGAILFFISDSALFFVRFDKTSVLKTHFLVMLTYSVGELLIVLGLR